MEERTALITMKGKPLTLLGSPIEPLYPARSVVGRKTKAPLPSGKGAFVLEVSEGARSLQGPPGFMAGGVR